MAIINNIILNAGSGSKFLEATCLDAGGLTPGMCASRIVNGIRRATSVGAIAPLPPIIVVEDINRGFNVTDSYAINDEVSCRYLRSGDVFYGLLADGESIAESEYVGVSGGVDPGYFILAGNNIYDTCGVALETASAATGPVLFMIEVR